MIIAEARRHCAACRGATLHDVACWHRQSGALVPQQQRTSQHADTARGAANASAKPNAMSTANAPAGVVATTRPSVGRKRGLNSVVLATCTQPKRSASTASPLSGRQAARNNRARSPAAVHPGATPALIQTLAHHPAWRLPAQSAHCQLPDGEGHPVLGTHAEPASAAGHTRSAAC